MDPFVAEIRIFAFNFAPKGWAACNGQIMAISQNTALFSLLGTTYGGNGTSNFALPNMQGDLPIQPGQGPGLSLYDLGQTGGTPNVTLLTSEMPVHTHALNSHAGRGGTVVNNPQNNVLSEAAANSYLSGGSANQLLNNAAVGIAGGSQPHNNLMPYLVLNYCIALQGVFPPRG